MANNTKGYNNFNFRVFLLILLSVSIFSVLVKLSKNFRYSLNVPLTFINIPKNQVLDSVSAASVKLTGTDMGYDFLKLKLAKENLEIDLSKLQQRDSTIYFYAFQDYQEQIATKMNGMQIRSFMPDTIYFQIEQNIERVVPVLAKSEISYTTGYGSLEGVTLEVAQVKLSGPEHTINALDTVYTQTITHQNLKEGIVDSIALELGEKGKFVSATPALIKYRVPVDRFTEGSTSVPLQLVNVPSGLTAKVFPKSIVVIYNVNFENYEKVKPSDFKIVCDFDEVDSKSTTISPQIVTAPQYVRDLRLREKTVQFLLIK
ncbi:MAG: hypothetical protein WBG71_14845 [Leeuwenhoekiella sp.]